MRLTPLEIRVVLTWAAHAVEAGASPPLRVLAKAMDSATNVLHGRVRRLIRKGWIGGAAAKKRLLRCAVCGAQLGRCPCCQVVQIATCGDPECVAALLDLLVPRRPPARFSL